jgi:pantothenate kinase
LVDLSQSFTPDASAWSVLGSITDAVHRAEGLIARGGRVLGIAGQPGSGKSTASEALVSSFGGAVVVPMDGFHLDDAELSRLGRSDRKGAPDTFDGDGFVATVARIHGRAQDVYVPLFDRDRELSVAGARCVPADAPLVIVEGNYLLLDRAPWNRVRAVCDEIWMIEVDAAVRRDRLIQRHVGHGRSVEAATAWVDRSDEANARLVALCSTRPDALLHLDDGR